MWISFAFVASLVAVSNCYWVRLYDQINYQGATKDVYIETSTSCVNIYDFNDRAMSVYTWGQCALLFEHDKCNGRSIKVQSGSPTHDLAQFDRMDRQVSSVGGCDVGKPVDPMAIPAETWRENWGRDQGFAYQHNDVLYRQYYDNDIVVYFDERVRPDATWMRNYMGSVWRYIKSAYGPFGNGRFHLIYHAGKNEVSGFVC